MTEKKEEQSMQDRLKSRIRLLLWGVIFSGVAISLSTTAAAVESGNNMEDTQREIKELKEAVQELTAEVQKHKETESDKSPLDGLDSTLGKLKFGGYGEVHANFTEGSEKDLVDFHRLVLYMGYDFADWITFNSETELEHAFVSDDDGEISVEQAYIDFLLKDNFNIRAGRILTPIGIINKKHEPPTFNGVERPSFAKYIIPTTWSSDGIGIFGSLNPSMIYEAYVVGGLDGSEFDDISGIRDGRIKERPSLNDLAVTGRLDYYLLPTKQSGSEQSLRLGASGYFGGLDNGNRGENPGIDGEIGITSADFEYSIKKLDFRGAIAHTKIDEAEQIGNNVAEEIFGWYLEGAYHYWPEEWKVGKLAKSDATVFLRYDDYDTQYKMPSGVSKNGAGDRTEWTFGTNFYLTPNLVVKADYQIRNDDSENDVDDLFNLGIGWAF